jgi:hypothetical protein
MLCLLKSNSVRSVGGKWVMWVVPADSGGCACVSAVGLKTKCRDLILAWSAPIFADADAEMRKRRAREREHRYGRRLSLTHSACHCQRSDWMLRTIDMGLAVDLAVDGQGASIDELQLVWGPLPACCVCWDTDWRWCISLLNSASMLWLVLQAAHDCGEGQQAPGGEEGAGQSRTAQEGA